MLSGLGEVNRELARELGRRCPDQRIATVDQDREKAGTIEAVHDAVKNELAGGVMPSKYFGANAAWLRLAVIAHNVLTALKRIALPAELLRARPKRLRFPIIDTAGRIVEHACKRLLRLAALADRIALWKEAMRPLPVATEKRVSERTWMTFS